MKFTETIEIGAYVVLNKGEMAAVYTVVEKHKSLNAYRVGYSNLQGRVTAFSDFMDIGAIEYATTEQIGRHLRQQAADRLEAGENFAS